MSISPSRQRNAVSEGMALGLIICDRPALPWDKVAIDLSFEGAWRSWQYRRRFLQVDTDIRHGSDGVRVMTRANERRHTTNFFWDTDSPEISIYPRGVWSDGEIDTDQAAMWIDGDVSASGWHELAANFVRRFKKERSLSEVCRAALRRCGAV